jgi:hypothetical protein
MQKYGTHKPNRDYEEDSPLYEKVKSDNCFYFPLHVAIKYISGYKSNSKRLYADIRVLADHGFIEIVSSGKNTKTKSIYKFSSMWKQWREKPP